MVDLARAPYRSLCRRVFVCLPRLSKSELFLLVMSVCSSSSVMQPNSISVSFCTGCSFPASKWDIVRQPDNVFLEIVNGKAKEMGVSVSVAQSLLHRTVCLPAVRFGITMTKLSSLTTSLACLTTTLTPSPSRQAMSVACECRAREGVECVLVAHAWSGV